MSVAAVIALITLGELAFVAATLRTAAIARRADAISERHWRQLARLHSDSGIAFFPTAEAMLELELALTEVVELERRPPPAPRWRTPALA